MAKPIDLGKILTDLGFDFFTGSISVGNGPILQHAENLGLYYRVSSDLEPSALAFGASLCGKLPVITFTSEALLKALSWMTTIDATMETPFLGIIEMDSVDFDSQNWANRYLEDLVLATGGRVLSLPDSPKKAASLVNRARDYMKNTNKPFFIRLKRGDLAHVLAVPKVLKPLKTGLFTAEGVKETISKGDALKVLAKEKKGSLLIFQEEDLGRRYYKIAPGTDTLFLPTEAGFTASVGLALSHLQPKDIIVVDRMSDILKDINPLITNGFYQRENLLHIVFDVEGESLVDHLRIGSYGIDLVQLALAVGYPQVIEVRSLLALREAIKRFHTHKELTMVYMKVKSSLDKCSPIPISPMENKKNFIKLLQE